MSVWVERFPTMSGYATIHEIREFASAAVQTRLTRLTLRDRPHLQPMHRLGRAPAGPVEHFSTPAQVPESAVATAAAAHTGTRCGSPCRTSPTRALASVRSHLPGFGDSPLQRRRDHARIRDKPMPVSPNCRSPATDQRETLSYHGGRSRRWPSTPSIFLRM